MKLAVLLLSCLSTASAAPVIPTPWPAAFHMKLNRTGLVSGNQAMEIWYYLPLAVDCRVAEWLSGYSRVTRFVMLRVCFEQSIFAGTTGMAEDKSRSLINRAKCST